MKRLLLPVFLLLYLTSGCFQVSQDESCEPIEVHDTTWGKTDFNVPAEAMILISAYPEQKIRYEDNKIIFADGYSIIFDDGKEKDFATMLDNSDIEDMFSLSYGKDSIPEFLADAGRSRCDSLFKKMYGKTPQEAQQKLANVDWFGQKVKFTSVNGANKQLEMVAEEIAQSYPELEKYMKCCGSFYWRQVRGANRMSAHSYGIAIDINTEYSDYWLWKNPNASEIQRISYSNRIPLEIVQVFEKHGFVWGGRWYHYDTMHFEYRPEINLFEQSEARQQKNLQTICIN